MSKLHIVMYHYVRELQVSRYPEIKGLEYSLFEQQLKFFKKNFHVVTMEQVIAYMEKKESLPERAVLLTFDDGYIDHFTYVFPMLMEFGMQGSFFVPGKVFTEHCLLDVNKIHFLLASAPIEVLYEELLRQLNFYRGQEWQYEENQELIQKYAIANRYDCKETIFFKRILQVVLPEELRGIIVDALFQKYVNVSENVIAHELYMNYDQMKLMKKSGMYFGVHGYDHYWMNRLPLERVEDDIDKALESMAGLIDIKKWVINYPYGSYSQDIFKKLNDKGTVLGLSTDIGIADLDKDNRFALPRLDTNDFPPKSQNYLLNKLYDFK